LTLLADIKVALRVTADGFDSEAQTLIDAALYDMERAGVNPALLEKDADGDIANAFVKQAVTAYCKAHFGYDNAEAERFDDAYRRIQIDLLNSSENIAAIDPEPETEPEGEPAGEPEGESEEEGE